MRKIHHATEHLGVGKMRYDLLCFGNSPWDDMWKRTQSLVNELSQQSYIENVLFVNPCWKKNNKYYQGTSPVWRPDNVSIYTPSKLIKRRGVWQVIQPFVQRVTRRHIDAHINNNIILLINRVDLPFAKIINRYIDMASLTIFDLSDDFTQFDFRKLQGVAVEYLKQTLARVNLVVTVNDHLNKKFSVYNRNIHTLRNASGLYNFSYNNYDGIEVLMLKREYAAVIGYVGTANALRFNCELMRELLVKHPEKAFVVIGNAYSDVTEKLAGYKNFIVIKPVPYDKLPGYMQHFDACIVPFKANEHTKGNDLLKIYDYLSLGKPIITTDIGSTLDEFRQYIQVASDCTEFSHYLEAEVSTDSFDKQAERKHKAMQYSWKNRADILSSLIRNELGLGNG